jgi:hypothetical protein
MTGIDEISRSIGGLEANYKTLQRTFDQHCQSNEAQHREICQKVDHITEVLAPLSEAVKVMKPIVDSYQTTRLKFAGALGIVLLLLGFVGWFTGQVIIGAIKWMFGVH